MAYSISKFTLLSGITVIQSVFLVLLTTYICDIPGPISLWCLLASGMSVAGCSLGLAISALARREEEAVAAIPILLIPQIIMGGAIAELSGLNENLAQAGITSYWGFDSSQSIIQDNSLGFVPLTMIVICLLYTSPSPRDKRQSRMPSSA